MKDFVIRSDRANLMQRMGDISQLAGLKRYELADGKAKGVEAVDFWTGSGFAFTVLPGRGMDIAWASYKGVPVAYMSKTGIAAPAYYESEGFRWLRNFFAGLLTTCGLSNAGLPCADKDPLLGTEEHGLHGRISNMGADNVCVKEEWQGDEFVMTVSGRLRESRLFGENLTLKREISAVMGESRLRIRDVVANEGFHPQPMMVLYHINFGYPLLDAGSRMVCNSAAIIANTDAAEAARGRYNLMGPPVEGATEHLYFHDPVAGKDGWAAAALVNDALELGAYVRFRKDQLPKLSQWKSLAASEYVLGIEPGNCLPVGRVKQRERGGLEILPPGGRKDIEVEIGILDGAKAIAAFRC